MQEGRNAIRRVVHQPVLNGNRPVAKHIGVARLLHAELREVAYAVGYQLTALGCVEFSVFVEEFVHIHAPKLGDALFLRHLVVEFVDLLFHIST